VSKGKEKENKSSREEQQGNYCIRKRRLDRGFPRGVGRTHGGQKFEVNGSMLNKKRQKKGQERSSFPNPDEEKKKNWSNKKRVGFYRGG